MHAKTKKHVLKAAKDSVHKKYSDQIESLHESLFALQTSPDHLDEEGALMHAEDAPCKICSQINTVQEDINSIQAEWSLWEQRAKKNKRKVGKRVNWTNQRDQAPMRTVNNEALEELKKTRKETSKTQVGISWLAEGALVTKRGKKELMIVTQIRGNSAECLKDGTTQWHRNVSLRPADWMLED